MTTIVKIGDNILISPDLTGQKQWIEGAEWRHPIFNAQNHAAPSIKKRIQ